MALADDNFASIMSAVKEGRTVYNNIEKAMLFMLPTNVAQPLVIMTAIFVGFTAPITAPQILWVKHGDIRRTRASHLFRTPRARRHAATSSCGQSSYTQRLRNLAYHLCWIGIAHAHIVGVLPDEVEWRVGRTCPRRCRERLGYRPNL